MATHGTYIALYGIIMYAWLAIAAAIPGHMCLLDPFPANDYACNVTSAPEEFIYGMDE